MPIRCVTFDWGDTLATNRGNPYLASLERALAGLAQDLEAMGHRIPDGWADRSMQTVIDEWSRSGDSERHPDNRERDAMAPLRAALGEVDGLPADTESGPLGAALDGFFAAFMQVLMPFPGVHDCLRELRARGLRIGILSHVVWPPRYCLAWYRANGLAELVDFYSLSSGVGWIKPHPAHYQDAIDQAGLPAAEILHVGDHPERDICGAAAFGFHTCLKHTEGYYDDALLRDCAPDLRVLHVKEIPGLLATHDWDER